MIIDFWDIPQFETNPYHSIPSGKLTVCELENHNF